MHTHSLAASFTVLVVASLFTFPIGNSSAEVELNCTHCSGDCDNITRHCHGNCDVGFYGDGCNISCPSNCSSTAGCNRTTGICHFCVKGFSGKFCDKTCSQFCRFGCMQNGECYGCVDNRYGRTCQEQCPANCGNNACDAKSGACKYGCTTGNWGVNCTHVCPQHCSLGSCHQSSGYCVTCIDGYSGHSCDSLCLDKNCKSCDYDPSDCFECKTGWYGKHCNMSCPEHCLKSTCSMATGKCTCEKGWTGEDCSVKCIDNCDRCLDNYTCNVCSAGFYGRHCNMSCMPQCATCDRNGKCRTCKENNFGDQCLCKTMDSTNCSSVGNGTWYASGKGCCPCSENCKNGAGKCNETTGHCVDGCQPGYFGLKCLDTCSSHCAGNGTCNEKTGECPNGCENDWLKPTCDYGCSLETPHCKNCTQYETSSMGWLSQCSVCDAGYYTDIDTGYCKPCENCLHDKCASRTGLCTLGCKKGWHSLTGIDWQCTLQCNERCATNVCNSTGGSCTEGCISGYYGIYCSLPCNENCVNNTCDSSSGNCQFGCKPGYFSDRCNSMCFYCLNGLCNGTGVCNECLPKRYGMDCSSVCSDCKNDTCDRTTGQCLQGCSGGMSGPFCNSSCVSSCQTCNETSGECLSCHGNYVGDRCEKLRSCNVGFWGDACHQKCNKTCKDTKCEVSSGVCTNGCQKGWKGLFCEVNNLPVKTDGSTGLSAGSVVGVGIGCFVAALVFVFVVYSLRRRRAGRKSSLSEYTLK